MMQRLECDRTAEAQRRGERCVKLSVASPAEAVMLMDEEDVISSQCFDVDDDEVVAEHPRCRLASQSTMCVRIFG